MIEIIWFGWRYVGRRKGERNQSLNMVVSDSLGAGVPWFVITQLKTCPVERLGPYLTAPALTIVTSVQFSTLQLSTV